MISPERGWLQILLGWGWRVLNKGHWKRQSPGLTLGLGPGNRGPCWTAPGDTQAGGHAPGQPAQFSNRESGRKEKGYRGGLQTSVLALSTVMFRAGSHLVWGLPLPCTVLSGTPGPAHLMPVALPTQVVTTENVFRHCKMSPGHLKSPLAGNQCYRSKETYQFF